jgi:DNA repair protein RadC
VEHLTLLVSKEAVALALIRHFGSLKGLARASFQELRQFLPRRKAEAVVAALSMSAIVETEHARSEQLDNPESIYRACADMKLFNQEVLRVILLDTRHRRISTVEITKGSINESLAHPRDIFGPSSNNRLMLLCSCTTYGELLIGCVMWTKCLCDVAALRGAPGMTRSGLGALTAAHN